MQAHNLIVLVGCEPISATAPISLVTLGGIIGMSASASLLAGTVMFYFGWTTLMLVPIPGQLAFAAALVLIR